MPRVPTTGSERVELPQVGEEYLLMAQAVQMETYEQRRLKQIEPESQVDGTDA